MKLTDWPFNEYDFRRSLENAQSESFPIIYSNIGVSFHETVPLIGTTIMVRG